MLRIFTPQSPYTKRARFAAIVWTLLIFIACFTPARELPEVHVPLIDKWAHFILFAGFAFLWLCAHPRFNARTIVTMLVVSIALGACIEVLQGYFVSLGRSMEFMDAVADSIGAVIGIALFGIGVSAAKSAKK